MEYITKIESLNTCTGCYVDCITLLDGRVLMLNDEYVGLYKDIESFLSDDGTKCQNGFSL